MDPITAIAASGMRARMESLDLLANNVANASTGGYKADREFYSLYVAPGSAGADPGDSTQTMPVIERHWTDLSQGVVQNTGNPLDVALSGKGFFTVRARAVRSIHAQRQFPSGARTAKWSPRKGTRSERRR